MRTILFGKELAYLEKALKEKSSDPDGIPDLDLEEIVLWSYFGARVGVGQIEKVFIGGDFTGHIGDLAEGFEEVSDHSWWNDVVRGKVEAKKMAYKRFVDGSDDEAWERRACDLYHVRCVKGSDGRALFKIAEVANRWGEYFRGLQLGAGGDSRLELGDLAQSETHRDFGDCRRISQEEVARAIRGMTSGRALRSDEIPVEFWKFVGRSGLVWLTKLLNVIFKTTKMPDKWRESVLIPLYKGKGDIQSCENYKGIKLLSHTMKELESRVDVKIDSHLVPKVDKFQYLGSVLYDKKISSQMKGKFYRSVVRGLLCFIVQSGEQLKTPRSSIICGRDADAAVDGLLPLFGTNGPNLLRYVWDSSLRHIRNFVRIIPPRMHRDLVLKVQSRKTTPNNVRGFPGSIIKTAVRPLNQELLDHVTLLEDETVLMDTDRLPIYKCCWQRVGWASGLPIAASQP
ncbi:unnamed protein product [Cuscuta campestris]|uniref:Reverse transcriptase domain-containing protein n=1 Tax=Cuscuta campestris TaxID=132261 RepID=A0A484K7L6_9ASTE|nr:unnamed protein product [Cuscuta campestris]